jgi:hypothetical protein
MDLNCDACRLEQTKLNVRFAGEDYEYARASFPKDLRLCRLPNQLRTKIFTAGANKLKVRD